MPLSGLDSAVLLLGLIAALLLYGLRLWRRRVSAPGQFLLDWLGVWTIIELALIGISSMNRTMLGWIGLHPPNPAEIIRSNGLLLPISMLYCAGLVSKNTVIATWEALAEPDKTAGPSKEEPV